MRDFSFTKIDQPTMAEFNKRFNAIADFENGIGNEYVWEKGVSDIVYDGMTISSTVTFDANKKLLLLYKANTLKDIVDGNSQQTGGTSISASQLASMVNGTYFVVGEPTNTSIVYYVPAGTSWSGSSNAMNPATCTVYSNVRYGLSTVGYVNSSDPNAYPPDVDDGYTYEPLGQLGEKTRISTGSYVGTGTYGESNHNSLTFEFTPKLVVVSRNGLHPGGYSNQWDSGSFIWTYGQTSSYKYNAGSASQIYIMQFGNILIWYSKNGESGQCNDSGGVFYYIAIG